jgi:hypothetical protein
VFSHALSLRVRGLGEGDPQFPLPEKLSEYLLPAPTHVGKMRLHMSVN